MIERQQRCFRPFEGKAKPLISGPLRLGKWLGWVVLAAAFAVQGQGQPVLQIHLLNAFPQIVVSGGAGSLQVLEGTESLAAPTVWRALTWRQAASPWSWVDVWPSSSSRSYRVRVYTNLPPANPDPAKLAWIPPGTFIMGSPSTEAGRYLDETQHTVTLSKGFYMGMYLVTQQDYLAVISNNPSYFSSSNYYSEDLSRPVEQVSWNEAKAYCTQLTQQEQAAGRLPAGWVYRLPTEGEWEYACRAGTTRAFSFGNAIYDGMADFNSHYEYDAGIGDIPDANPSGYVGMTLAVGSYPPNPWGLFDTHGNVWEWCLDWYGGDYPAGDATDPQGSVSGSNRVFRGGAWSYVGRYCRSDVRNSAGPDTRRSSIGFRLVLAPSQ
jgi:sulfatase modifying factor 1